MEVYKGKKRNNIFLFFLIIVFLIITFAVLSSVLFFKENEKRRDEQRIEDLKNVKEALYLYYSENYRYPSSLSVWEPEKSDFGADVKTGAMDYNNLASLLSNHLPVFPKDPLNIANTRSISEKYLYRYVSSSNGQDFVIVFETEDLNDSSPALIKGW